MPKTASKTPSKTAFVLSLPMTSPAKERDSEGQGC